MTFRLAALLTLVLLVLTASAAFAQGADAPLRRGDMLMVKLGGDSVVSAEYPIESDGSVLLPRVGRVNLADVPASGIPSIVRQSLSKVFMAGEAIVRPMRRVTVVGEVAKPGVYFLDLMTSLRDAVAESGALSTYADTRYVVLLRAGVERRLDNWQRSAEAADFIVSGDVLSVPRESWIKRNALNVVSSLGIVITTLVAVTR